MKRLFGLLGRIEELTLSLTFLGLALVAVIQVFLPLCPGHQLYLV